MKTTFTVKPGNKARLDVDALTLCYTCTPARLAHIEAWVGNESEGFRLVEPMHPDEDYEHLYLIQIPIVEDYQETGEWMEFGAIYWGRRRLDTRTSGDPLVWIRIQNRMLYMPLHTGTNSSIYADHIAYVFGLKFNNLTKVDVAYDTTLNAPMRIKRAIRCKRLVPIVKGRAKCDPKACIHSILYLHTGNQERYTSLTLYLGIERAEAHGRKRKSLEMRVYDKGKEITANPNKGYIRDWVGTRQALFRVEISMDNQNFRAFWSKHFDAWRSGNEGDPSTLLFIALSDPVFLFQLFVYQSNRLLRFKDAKKRKTYNLIDILTCPANLLNQEARDDIPRYPLPTFKR